MIKEISFPEQIRKGGLLFIYLFIFILFVYFFFFLGGGVGYDEQSICHIAVRGKHI